MSKDVIVTANSKSISGSILLSGSKSISNRVLLIRALCNQNFNIENLSDSDDTQTLMHLLTRSEGVFDAGHAGTTFRFLTAFLAFKSGTQILTGSERMLQRPILALVQALNTLGANITYLGQEGYPPLQIGPPSAKPMDFVVMPSNISSQYISALLMIAPTLPNGLSLKLVGETVSRPYLDMTLSIMNHFGINHEWKDDTITIPPQTYLAKNYHVEADWSAASYYYSLAAIADEASIDLVGLHDFSIQGDAAIAKIGEAFGVHSSFINDYTLRLTKQKDASVKPFFENNFLEQPDLAQSIIVICGALGVPALFSGLETLLIKETNRIEAMTNEMAKLQVFFSKVPQRFKQNDNAAMYMLEGKAAFDDLPIFDTYHDHRMAMALTPLSLLHPIIVRDANVVSKSYPNFWKDLACLGIIIDEFE